MTLSSRWRHCAGRLAWPAILTGALSSGCSLVGGNSAYQVQIPVLHAQPLSVPCVLESGEKAQCTALLESDYEAIVRELKTACLALRGTPTDCQTE